MEMVRHQTVGVDLDGTMLPEPVQGGDDRGCQARIGKGTMGAIGADDDVVGGSGVAIVEVTQADLSADIQIIVLVLSHSIVTGGGGRRIRRALSPDRRDGRWEEG